MWKSVGSVLRCGEGVKKFEGSTHTLLHLSHTPQTHLTPLFTLPSLNTHFLTPSLTPLTHFHLTPPPHLPPHTSSHSRPTLLHTLYTSSNTSSYSPHFLTPPTPPPTLPYLVFIIYPIPKFLTFLIYCQLV